MVVFWSFVKIMNQVEGRRWWLFGKQKLHHFLVKCYHYLMQCASRDKLLDLPYLYILHVSLSFTNAIRRGSQKPPPTVSENKTNGFHWHHLTKQSFALYQFALLLNTNWLSGKFKQGFKPVTYWRGWLRKTLPYRGSLYPSLTQLDFSRFILSDCSVF